MLPDLEDAVSQLPIMKRSFVLTARDWVLVVDLMMLLVPLSSVLNQVLLDDDGVKGPMVWSSLLTLIFAAWLGKRYKNPPPEPSDNLLRRTIALALLGVGGGITLVGAVIFVFVFVNWSLDSGPHVPWFVVALAALPALFGHALMYGGARVRVGRARP